MGHRVLTMDPSAAGMHAVGPGGLGNVKDVVGALKGGVGEASPAASTEATIANARAASVAAANGRQPLPGLPQEPVASAGYYVPGPIGKLHDIAEQYSRESGIPYTRPTAYEPIDVNRSKAIAQAFDEMPHAPNDPAVKASYDAMIRETLGQYNALKNSGYTFEPIPPGAADPYAATPRLAAKDLLENGHLWYFPTQSGYGTGPQDLSGNPMLNDSGERINGQPLLNNDVFRIVHDVFGHFKEGNGFRATGEDNAWRSHAGMYSDLARPAMTSETRGQNSWVNYGPHGDANRNASAADTVYADQKVGLMPPWTYDTGPYNPDATNMVKALQGGPNGSQ